MISLGFGRSKRTVGLDVGSSLVKVAVVDHSGDVPEVEKVGLRPLVADAIVDDEVTDPGLVADTISALFEEEGIDERRVVVSVGGRDVIVKPIQMDRMTEEDAREVIRWEAEQHVPFDIEEVQLDFEITDPEGEGLQMNVLLVAAKRELVNNKLSLFKEAGLEPVIVDVEAFALYNALEANHPEALEEAPTALVSIGHDSAIVTILDVGVPVLVRELNFGTRRLREELQRRRGMSSEEAEEVLAGHAAEDAESREILDEQIRQIAQGVERAAVFLETQKRRGGIDHIYVSGGGVRVPGLVNALAEDLRVEVRVVNPVRRLEVKPGAFDFVEIEEVAPVLFPAVGLGLRRPA